jgi:hypothetical protein
LDFFTDTGPAAVPITIDGKEYRVPRVLMSDLKTWAAKLVDEQIEFATKGLKPEEKADYLVYRPKPVIDIGSLMQHVGTPEGTEYVVNTQLRTAGVPDDVRAKLVANAPASQLQRLAQMLTLSREVLVRLGIDVEETRPPNGLAQNPSGNDPLATTKDGSGVSPETGDKTPPATTPSTAAQPTP